MPQVDELRYALRFRAKSVPGSLFCRTKTRFVQSRFALAAFHPPTSIFKCRFLSEVVFPAGKYENILVEKKGEKQNVGVITLNRPKALNALCNALMVDVNNALEEFQNDDSVGAIVLTGSERAFAAGNIIFYVIVSPLKDINLSQIV